MQTIDLYSAFAIHDITPWLKNYILLNVMHTWAVALLPIYSDSRQVFFDTSGDKDLMEKKIAETLRRVAD
jgi:hypothetical protein